MVLNRRDFLRIMAGGVVAAGLDNLLSCGGEANYRSNRHLETPPEDDNGGTTFTEPKECVPENCSIESTLIRGGSESEEQETHYINGREYRIEFNGVWKFQDNPVEAYIKVNGSSVGTYRGTDISGEPIFTLIEGECALLDGDVQILLKEIDLPDGEFVGGIKTVRYCLIEPNTYTS